MRRLLVLSLLLACTNTDTSDPTFGTASDELRDITSDEAVADFDTIVHSMRSLYGPLDRKQARYSFDFDQLVADYRARVQAAKTEANATALFHEFLGRFEDAHISLSAPLYPDSSSRFTLGFLAVPVGDTYAVHFARPETSLQLGDELIAVDGKMMADVVADLSRFVSNPNPTAERHFAAYYATFRPFYMAQGISEGSKAQVHVKGADGQLRVVNLPWRKQPSPMPKAPPPPPPAGESDLRSLQVFSPAAAEVITASLVEFGNARPFYLTPQVLATLQDFEQVSLTAQTLVRFNLTAQQALDIGYFAAKYRTGDKRVLFVRLPDFMPADMDLAFNYLRAVLAQERDSADVLVFDETHNPGGRLFFAHAVASLLAKKPFNTFLQHMRADRKWIASHVRAANTVRAEYPDFAVILEERARLIDAAYSAGETTTPPLPVFDTDVVWPADEGAWTKPVVLVADEMSVSCGDILPMIFKSNGMGTLFGTRTMGGGGNVEIAATLPNTQGVLAFTRGVGTIYDPSGAYPESLIIEDNGVMPDVSYTPSLADYRSGYVGFVNALNEVARQAQ